MPNPTNTTRALSRDILKSFLPNHESIRAFEQIMASIDSTLPTTIEEVGNVASGAAAVAYALAAELQAIADQVAELSVAPAQQSGTIAPQNADSVDIDGGSIDGTTIGASSAAPATVSALIVSGNATITGILGVTGSINGNSVGTVTSVVAGGAFGCNGKPGQTAVAAGALVSTTGATNTTPFGYTTAAQANDIVTKLNIILTALKANGILS